ncbi:MAG: phenylacetate--CoA ligase family protein [Bacillota bacterium]
MTPFFNQKMETASLDEIRSLQSKRLREIVSHVYKNSPVQRERFKKAGISAEDVRGLEQLTALPTMNKELLRETYPLGLCCVDHRTIAEMHMSSGSTGTPIVMPYTLADLDQWAECMARCMVMAGAVPHDVVQITPSFGLFNGGFGFYHGARKLGLFVIPTGAGNTPRQIRLARDFKTRVLTGVVSYGVRIMEVLQEEGGKLPDLKIGIFGAETFSDSMKKRLSSELGMDVFDIYGMTETGGVGTLGQDCPAHHGIHVWEDHYIVEILDRSGKPVLDGELGELTITALTRQALPVIRFRTGDLTRILSREKCSCGRSHVRIAPIAGRVDDMLIVKGVNFFPRQVEQALMEIPGVRSNYQIIIEEVNGVKDVRINVEADPGVTGYMVEKHLKEALGFSPKGDVFPVGGLPRQEGKAKRVFYKDENGLH